MRAAERRGEELDLSSLELGHVRSREKPGEFGVAGDTPIEIVNHGDQGRFSADGIVDARSRSGAHCWLLRYVSAWCPSVVPGRLHNKTNCVNEALTRLSAATASPSTLECR